MKKLRIFFTAVFLSLLFTSNVFSQCYMTAFANGDTATVEICLGDTVVLTSDGNCPSYLMNNDFNDMTPGVGWQATNQAMFTNPCTPHSPDGTPYLWMGSTSTAPRILTTIPFDVSGGGFISFEMRYAVQSVSSPCEGPDLYNEGVSLQYSINGGATWIDIVYFAPNGDILTTTPTATSPGASGQTPFTVWSTFTYPIPPAAQTTSTSFRWAQLASTSAIYDHWGLDNVVIGVPPPNIQIWWDHGPTVANPPAVAPTTTTTYTAYVTDQTDTVHSSVQVIVHQPPTMQINNLPAQHCVNGDSSVVSGTPVGGIFSGPGMVGDVFYPDIAGLGSHDITYSYHVIGNTIGYHNIFEDCFFTNKGWTGYGGPGGWTRGVAAVAASCSGSNGPGVDHTQNGDNFILGTFLGACYTNNMPANNYITSPVIDCSGYTNVELEYWRWAGCESSTYDRIGVQVFDGTAWTTVWQNAGSFSDNTWTQQVHNVSAAANNNPNFRIRFYIGPTDGSVSYIGWNIDDVVVRGYGQVTDTLCSFSTTATTLVVESPTATFSMPDTICVNETLTINYTGTATAAATYTWDFDGGTVVSGTGSGPYVVSWANDGLKTISLNVLEGGCSGYFEEELIVLPLSNTLCACWTPPVSIIANSNVCENENLNITSDGLPTYVYTWNFAGGNVVSGSGMGPYSVYWPSAGTYNITLSVTDSACYPFDTSFVLTVNPVPQIGIVTTNEICDQKNATAIASGGSVYQWSNGGTSSTITGLGAGTYFVTVTEGQCSNTASATITNIPGPIAAFSVSSHTENILEATFIFTDLSVGATSWNWDFGDNNYSTLPNPTHTYIAPGDYTVTLNVADINNCSDFAQGNIKVTELHTFYVPSAFTPDGDGLNDVFGPQGIGINNEHYEFFVFDRWGKQQFYTNDVNHFWDGRSAEGNMCLEGFYTWMVLLKTHSGTQHIQRFKGTVMLVLP